MAGENTLLSGSDAPTGDEPENTPAPEGGEPTGNEPAGDAPTDSKTEGDPADKPDGEKADDDAKADDDKSEGPPEAYEWAAPEGFEGELDKDALGELEPVARELGLSNEQANKLLAIHANAMQRQSEQQQEQLTQTLETWKNELHEDSEFGGANFDANVEAARKAVSAFGGSDLHNLLDQSGLGSHPVLVKAFAKIGKAVSEDTMERGSGAGGARTAEEIMYGKQ